MAVLSWGKPLLEICKLEDGVIPVSPVWIKIDTPVQDSTKLDPAEGTKREALEEGGAVVDSFREKSKLTLTFDLFAKVGFNKPIEDEDGVITDNYAIRLTPQDPLTRGFILPNCTVSVGDSFSSADGEKWTYTFDALKPLDGGTMKRDYYGVAAKTLPATSITASDANLNGSFATKASVTSVGFEYKKKADTTWTDSPVSAVASPFVQSLVGLTAATTYEYKAYVTVGSSKYEGDTMVFITKA